MANRATRRKFNKALAKKTTRKFTCQFMDETVEFELRVIRGADDILAFRKAMLELTQKANTLQEARGDGESDIDKDMELLGEMNDYFVKMLKAVVVLDDADTLSDEDWHNLARNAGGTNGPLFNACLECVGMPSVKGGVEKEHVPT